MDYNKALLISKLSRVVFTHTRRITKKMKASVLNSGTMLLHRANDIPRNLEYLIGVRRILCSETKLQYSIIYLKRFTLMAKPSLTLQTLIT